MCSQDSSWFSSAGTLERYLFSTPQREGFAISQRKQKARVIAKAHMVSVWQNPGLNCNPSTGGFANKGYSTTVQEHHGP